MRDPLQQKEHEGLLHRRMRAMRDRKRDPGDLATWAVVLGAVMGIFLLLGTAYARAGWLGILALILLVAWWAVVTVRGGANVVSILWGESLAESRRPIDGDWVRLPTLVLAVATALITAYGVVSDQSLGWPGLVGLGAALAFLMLFSFSWFRTRS